MYHLEFIMKITKISFLFIFIGNFLFGVATFNQNASLANLVTAVQGIGITITNPVLTRGRRGGALSQTATFTNGIVGANLSIDEGILLTSSSATEAFSTNDSGSKSINPGNIGPAGNDPDLLGSLTNPFNLFNQVVFEFDVTLDNNTRLLLVDYQFASDEYPEWVGSQFNDAFGFFISGGDLNQTYNIARVVNDSIIVSVANINAFPTVNINNLNIGTVGSQSSGQPVDLTNGAFFIDNGGTNAGLGGLNPANVVIESEFDGFSVGLHATIDNLTPGQTYHFKMALADTADTQWDAGVFINKIIGVREPALCYDYDVRIGSNIDIATNDSRHIQTQTFPGEEFNLGIVLQSLDGEINFTDTNLTVIFNPNNSLRLDHAELSPDSINSYTPIPSTYINTIPNAQIPIGENITSSGGTISSNQVIFANLVYDVNGTGTIDTSFDLNSSLFMTLNGITIARNISTMDGSLERCPQEIGYHPLWASLNIERHDSQSGVAAEKHVLYTQIANRPFPVDVVSYDPNSTSTEQNINDLTVEVEIIDAGKYATGDHSLFTCREPTGVGSGKLRSFKTPTSRVEIEDFSTPKALRNAAFRLWYLRDLNNTVVNYTCAGLESSYGNTCFDPLYTSQFLDKIDIAPYRCQSACSGSTGLGSDNTCYQCLKQYFAKPICSRDNFSIRPEKLHIAIKDNDDSNSTTSPTILVGTNASSTRLNLAAEYNYIIDGNATQYNNTNNVTGYYASYNSLTAPTLQSKLLFTQAGTCANSNDVNMDIIFRDGIIKYTATGGVVNVNTANQFSHANVGDYDYHIEDTNWTIVDQIGYTDKTFPGVADCIDSGAVNLFYSTSADGNAKSGCYFHTAIDLALSFEPYQFDINGTDDTDVINFTLRPNNASRYLFLNDLNNSTYYTGNNIGTQLNLMAAVFSGNIAAEGKNGTVLSNFTSGCSASDVTINLIRTTSPTESILSGPLFNTELQQFLQYGPITNTIYDKQVGEDVNITLPSVAFTNASLGRARMQLYTTFKKSQNTPINPIKIQYNDLNATGYSNVSSAHMKTDYYPRGIQNYDQNITYVYGKISPKKRLYNNITESYEMTPIYVDIYCSLLPADCNTSYNLNTATLGTDENANWYLASPFLANELGTTNLVVSHLSEEITVPRVAADGNLPALTNANVTFDNPATQNDVNISVIGANRPSVIKVQYNPVPWLIFNPLTDFYRVRFIGPSSWAGVGKAGHVTDTTSSTENARRMNW
jgi:hypothetical protein